mgnify:CR=1 FL=1
MGDARRVVVAAVAVAMVWGKKTTVDAEFIAKAAASASVVIMPARTFGPEECVNLCAALCSSHTLTELGASGHAVGERGEGGVQIKFHFGYITD